MTRSKRTDPNRFRNTLALSIVVFSIAMVAAMAVYLMAVILKGDAEAAKDTFKTVLPVFTAWVSTVLVFYFGQRSFEVASEQAQKLAGVASARAESSVSSIMRPFEETKHLKIEATKTEKDVLLSALREQLKGEITRLPIVDADNRPRYMIHESSLDKYISAGGSEDHTLKRFITKQKVVGREFGPGKAFVVVAEDASIAEAKLRMDRIPFCQDIFVTTKGTSDEPLVGWVSNLRLAESLKT